MVEVVVKGTKKEKRDIKTVLSALLLAFAVIAFWRGVWGLLDLYLFPGHHELSLWISVAVGVVILYETKNLIRKLI